MLFTFSSSFPLLYTNKKCLLLWMACQYVSVCNVYDKMSTQSCSISGPLCFNLFSAYGSISVTLHIKKCIIFFPLDKSTLKGAWCIETVMHALKVTLFLFSPLLFPDPHLFLFLTEFKIKVFLRADKTAKCSLMLLGKSLF